MASSGNWWPATGLRILATSLAQVNRRRHQVRRSLASDLNNVFAEIGLDRLDTGGLESRIEVDLFGSHRLAFHDALCAAVAQDADDDLAGVDAVGGEMNLAATLAHVGFERFQMLVQIGQGGVLDRPGFVAHQA